MKKIEIAQNELSYEVEEEIKTLRTNLLFCGDDKKTIVITSSFQGEGKTNTAVELAKSLAIMQKKVLLLDTDLRKSVLISRLDAGTVEYGLSHFLSGQCSLGESIFSTNIPRLHIMFSGPSVKNSAELLTNERFEKMLESFRDIYDYIIIDSAPLGMVIDAAIVAKQCDGAIMVIESEKVKYRLAQEVKQKLEKSGCQVLGVVLNKVPRRNRKKYYGYGKYGEKYYK